MNRDVYAVIMAGGKGERFWPASRENRPKQLLKLVNHVTMIEESLAHLADLLPPENIIIMTSASLVKAVSALLPDIPPENIIGESVGRNTAPCIAAACGIINCRSKTASDATMMVLPSDHLIKDVSSFKATLQRILDRLEIAPAELFTIGITPTFPSSAYGYIKCGEAVAGENGILHGSAFVEKPSREKAEEFLAAGNYFWNGGMFIWRCQALMAAFAKHAPDLADLAECAKEFADMDNLDKFMAEIYPAAKSISIDYAIMEKVESFMVAPGAFDWDDIGSWSALGNHLERDNFNNAARGIFVGENVKSCIIYNDDPNHLVAAIDLNDMIIVNANNATLIAPISSDQRVREVVKQLKSKDELKKFL